MNNINENWQPPRPIRISAYEKVDFPTNALPGVLRELTVSQANDLQVDESMIGPALLAAASPCMTGVYKIQGKAGHIEPAVLDLLLIAPPGTQKSSVIRLFRPILIEFEKKYNAENKALIDAARFTKKKLQAEIDRIMGTKAPNIDRVVELQEELDSITDDEPLRIVVSDITPEKTVEIMVKNHTIAIIADEGGLFANFAGQYSGGKPKIDILLNGWDGASYINDRKGTGTEIIDEPYISICVACQQEVLEEMMENKAFNGKGLMARLNYVFPEQKQSKKYRTSPVNTAIYDRYKELMLRMLDRKYNRPTKNTQIIGLAPDAFDIYSDYVEQYVYPAVEGELRNLSDWAGKYHGLILRIALILHCVGHDDPVGVRVSAETIKNAIALGEFFKYGAVRAYNYRPLQNREYANMAYLLDKIRDRIASGMGETLNVNQIYSSISRDRWVDVNEFHRTVDALERLGYFRQESVARSGGGRRNLVIHINPLWDIRSADDII